MLFKTSTCPLIYPSSKEVVSLRQLDERVTRVRTRPTELVRQASQCTA